jgi:hypothetical protein
MKWATRPGVHVDRTACAWLIKRFIDPEAEFSFYATAEELPEDVTGFDMRGVELSHKGEDCSFETFLRTYEIEDRALSMIGQIVHEADLEDERFDAPEARGLDVIIRGLSMTHGDEQMIELTGPVYDGLYEYLRRATVLGGSDSPG